MNYLQIIALIVIGAFLGIVLMSMLIISKESIDSTIQGYGLSLTAVDGGGYICSIGTPRRTVGLICETPSAAVQSAVAEIEGAA